jgi:serine/threonine-protein kinase
MKPSSSDRNLLLGMIALQMDFVTRDELIAAMQAWTLEKSRALSDILLDRGVLEPDDKTLLETLVKRHMTRHRDDLEESLSSLAKPNVLASTLETIEDPDIQETLSRISLPRTEPMYSPDASVTAPHPAPGEPIAGRYHIVKLHDQGGIGSVFVAVDGEVNRQVALKQLRDDRVHTAQDRLRFVQEAEITGNLEHPGIVPVYGMGKFSDGRPYYAMRFIDGDNLKSAILALHADGKETQNPGQWRLEFQSVLRRFLVVCETVAYAHERGVIHRDLKPHNILLGKHGETLVVDWGLAKVVGRRDPEQTPDDLTVRPPSTSDLDPTDAGLQLGTPAFMSPEQAMGEVDQLTFATDIYSLGATLYMLLTGRAPFLGSDRAVVASMVRSGEFPTPRQVKPSLDLAINAICLKAMALNPENRYATPRALAEDLERWMADQPVMALPKEPFSTRRSRWIRHHRSLISNAAVILVLSVVGLAVFSWKLAEQIVQKEQALVRSARQRDMLLREWSESLKLASQRLAAFPGSETIRLELAQKAVAGYEKLRELFPDDPDIELEFGFGHLNLAGMHRLNNQSDESKTSYDIALRISERFLTDPKREPRARNLRAKSLLRRGELYQNASNADAAEADFKECLRQARHLQATHDTDYWFIDATAKINLSELSTQRRRHTEARQLLDDAIVELDRLAAAGEAPEPPDHFLIVLASALISRAHLFAELATLDFAIKDFDRAAQEAAKISPESAFHTSGMLQRATALQQLGDALLTDPIHRKDARKPLDNCITLMSDLAAKAVGYPYYREQLALGFLSRGRLNLAEKQIADAVNDSKQARSLLLQIINEKPESPVPDFLSELASVTELDIDILALDSKASASAIDELRSSARSLLEKALEIDGSRAADRQRLERLSQNR